MRTPVDSSGLYTDMVSHLCVFSCVLLVLIGYKNVSCICRNDTASLRCVFVCAQLIATCV